MSVIIISVCVLKTESEWFPTRKHLSHGLQLSLIHIYLVTYNGSYLAAEGIITIIVISIPPVKKALDYVKPVSYTHLDVYKRQW